MLKVLILLAFLGSPVLGTSCYTGTIENDPFNPSKLSQNTNCNSKYCTIENEYPGPKVKTIYQCGDWIGNGNYGCNGTYTDRQFTGTVGQITKTCCKGNYCNSSGLSGSFIGVIFSVFAILFAKIC